MGLVVVQTDPRPSDAESRFRAMAPVPLPETDSRTMRGLLRDDPFEATFEAAGVGLAIVDLTGRYVRVNDSFARLHAVAPEDLIGEPLRYNSDQLPIMLADANSDTSSRDEYEVREGTWASVGLRLRIDADGDASWFVVDAEDVSRRRRAERELEHRTLHDDLTGLANRVLVQDRLTLALARSARGAGDVGVIFCDLDGFKEINDKHGHLLGDIVLRVVASRLRAAVRPSDTVGRLGGDEFVIVVEPPVGDGDLAHLAARLTEVVAAPLREEGTDTRVGISVGFARSDGTDMTAERLMARADSEMYVVKRSRRKAPKGH